MKLTLKWTDLEPIESLDVFVDEKIGGLAKFLEKYDRTGVAEAWVEIGRTTGHHKTGGMVYRAETDIRLPGKVLRAEATHKDLRQAIVLVKKELERKIMAYKGAKEAKVKRGARLAKRMAVVDKSLRPSDEDIKGKRERNEGI
jgi:ribosomal subunit interface protein